MELDLDKLRWINSNGRINKMTTDEIMYKAFFVVWKVLKQSQPKRDLMREKYIKQYRNNEITKDEFETIYPEGINVALEIQKKRNMGMFIAAIIATSDDRWKRAKQLNQSKIDKLRRIRTSK